jgi:REP element-mobilizing transposase RayT
MARPLRIEYPGALYHVTTRGNARGKIFFSDEERHLFLSILISVVHRYHWICYGYCLMDNHYHLLIETLEGNLSLGMRHLNGLYTQQFNRQHHRIGHLFQGRYKAILVEKERHLLELCRYIVLNPVRAKRIKHPREWAWSSYQATLGEKEEDFVNSDWILAQFGMKHKKEAQKRYRMFVEEGIQQEASLWDHLQGQIFLGTERFVEGLQKQLQPAQTNKEVPKSQRYAGRPSLKKLFQEGESRDQAIYQAFQGFGYRLKEIGDYLNLHYTTISKIIKKIETEGEGT